MRFAIFLMVFFAGPVAALPVDYSTKAGCMAAMAQEIGMADTWSRVPDIQSDLLELVPAAGKEHAATIAEAYREIGRQYQIIADEFLKLCSSYD